MALTTFSTQSGKFCTECTIVECYGDKCRKSCDGEGGEYCISCNVAEHYENCTNCTFVSCNGADCDLSHADGRFVHCVSCNYGERHPNEPIEPISVDKSQLKLIDCQGNECGIHHRGIGHDTVHCTNCFPEEGIDPQILLM